MAEKTPVYLDFANGQIVEFSETDFIPAANVELVPTGFVVTRTLNVNPSDLGYGTWDYLGSAVIGVTTVYYFVRIE